MHGTTSRWFERTPTRATGNQITVIRAIPGTDADHGQRRGPFDHLAKHFSGLNAMAEGLYSNQISSWLQVSDLTSFETSSPYSTSESLAGCGRWALGNRNDMIHMIVVNTSHNATNDLMRSISQIPSYMSLVPRI